MDSGHYWKTRMDFEMNLKRYEKEFIDDKVIPGGFIWKLEPSFWVSGTGTIIE